MAVGLIALLRLPELTYGPDRPQPSAFAPLPSGPSHATLRARSLRECRIGGAMADQGVKLFLSCVSDEFGVYRDKLRRALTRPNVEVKIQEDFKALGGDTLSMLEEYIKQCEAVVHFAGDMTGLAPAGSSVEDLLARRPDLEAKLAKKGMAREALAALSYTQWEAWLAV